MPKIKDLPKHEMPREKLIEKGAESLRNSELLAILLRTGIEGKNVIEVADGILKKYSMKKLLSLDFKTISNVKGIGPAKATRVIFIKKSKTDNKTLFIDASTEFVRGGNKNKLSDANRAKILEAFTTHKDTEYFSKLVDNKAIAENDYNIAVSSYVEKEDTREVVDITELNKEIRQVVARQNELRTATDEIVSDIEGK